jgi:thiamine kinase-like enzyme
MTSEEVICALPFWRGEIELEPLSGGLSNRGFKVSDATGTYVARVGKDYPFHQVNRAREAVASHAAFLSGLSPEQYYARDGVGVFRFLGAKTFTEADVRQNLIRCVDLIKRCHAEMGSHITGQGAIFWVFQILRDYAQTISAAGHDFARHLPHWLEINAALERAQVPMPIVFGHHDLLAANILDDGERLWLIDWEYGAFGTSMFDLANLSVNNGFDPSHDDTMLAAYFGHMPDAGTLRAFDAMKAASGLRELMWAIVSDIHLKVPGVDYKDYAVQQIPRFEAAYNNYKKKHG